MESIESTRDERFALLSDSPWSQGMPREVLPRIAVWMDLRKVSAGERFVAETEEDPWMGVLIDGELEVVQTEVAAVERVVRIMGPGRMFGELALVDGSARSASIDVVTDVTFLCLTPPALQAMVEADPGAAYELMRRIASGLAQTIRTQERNRF